MPEDTIYRWRVTKRAQGPQSCDSYVLASLGYRLGVQTTEASFGQQAWLSRNPATGGTRRDRQEWALARLSI